MKNLKKVLALVVALTMVLGTVGFAAYTDVAVDADEYTAVSTLSSLGILTGYEDGSFKPEGDITRAEFCAVVCRLLGAKVAGSSATNFSDVPAEHWASAYIAHVAGLGIVNGMGDGTFAPDANVTYEQAVKMLVVALGYEPAAASKGGYPTGYMVVANTEGVTDGISAAQSAPASRGVVAQLAFNALDVPMMIQDGYGTQVSFKKADGKQLPYQTFLSDLGVAKLDGTVTATSKIGGAEAGEVEFTVAADGVYDSENFKFKANNSYDFVVGEGVNAEDYFQVDTTIYVRELKKGDFEIIAVMAGEDNESIELDYEVIESASATKITYNETGYSNDDEDLAINSGATWYFNNNVDATAASYVDAFVNSAAMQTAKDLKVTVIENDGKKGYDAVIVKEYEYDLVSEVEADKDRFYATNNVGTFAFDFEDEDKLISIVDKDGNAMKLADFAENDVIAYMYNNTLSNYTWIEVINYGQNAVTGAVNAKDGDALYIDDVEYANVSGGIIGLGEEGTFFLTASGKIFAYEISASVASNYGYILATGELASNGATTSSVWQVRMLTKDNEIVLFNVKDGYTHSSITSLDVNVGSNGDTGAFKTDVDKRLVTYKLNSKNEIIEVNPVIDNAANSAAGAYNASTGKLFGKYVDGATIFNIDVTQAASAFVTTSASFVDDNNYKGYAIANANGKYDCFLITEGGNEIDYTQNLAVVAGVRTTSIDSTEALKVTYYVAGETEAKEIVIMKDNDVSAPLTISAGSETVDPSVYSKVKQGAIMMFSDNGNGVASAYAVLANVAYGAANSAASVAYTNTDLISYINGNVNLETQIAVTYIDSYERKNGINITFGGGVGELALERGTACYTIDNATAASKSKITVGDWQATGIDKKIGDKANMAIVRVVDGSLVDLITLSAR